MNLYLGSLRKKIRISQFITFLGFRAHIRGQEFRVQGSGFRVQGSGFRV
jgi:hypothetical protein